MALVALATPQATAIADSDSVNLGSNPGPPAIHLPDMTVYFQFPRWHVEFPSRPRGSSKGWGTGACRLPLVLHICARVIAIMAAMAFLPRRAQPMRRRA